MEGIARFVQELRVAFPERSTAELEDAHIAAMMHVAHLMADNGKPVAKPVSTANGPENQASELSKPWRETIMGKFKTMFATRAAKVTAAAVAMFLALSGIAVAGVLPDPVQNTVADAVHAVGIDLPGGTDEVDVDNSSQSDDTSADAADDQLDQDDQDDADDVDEQATDESDQESDDEVDQESADEVDQESATDANDADHSDTSDESDESDAADTDGTD